MAEESPTLRQRTLDGLRANGGLIEDEEGKAIYKLSVLTGIGYKSLQSTIYGLASKGYVVFNAIRGQGTYSIKLTKSGKEQLEAAANPEVPETSAPSDPKLFDSNEPTEQAPVSFIERISKDMSELAEFVEDFKKLTEVNVELRKEVNLLVADRNSVATQTREILEQVQLLLEQLSNPPDEEKLCCG